MSLFKIYMEYSFAQEFINSEPERPQSFIGNPLWDVWVKYVELFLDMKKHRKEIDSSNEPIDLLLYIKKRMSGGYIEAIENYDKFDNIDFWKNLNPHSIFFLSNTEDCIRFEKDYGMFFISNVNMFNNSLNNRIRKQITPKNPPFQKWEEHPWENLIRFKHPCNYMIIADNYILDKPELMDINLFNILSYWLPDSLKCKKFDLFILTDGFIQKKITTIPKYSAKDRYDNVKKHLELIGKTKGYIINLYIIFNANSKRYPHLKNHGRNILTNYFKMHVDHSFSMFNKNKECTINAEFYIGSILDEFIRDSINELKTQYYEIINNAKNLGTEIQILPQETKI